jgi:ATP-binding cassette subfamily B protein
MGAAFGNGFTALANQLAVAGLGIATPGLVSAAPHAVLDGLDSATGEGLRNALILAAGALLAGELLALVIGFHTTNLYRRLDEAVLARVMRACLAPPGTTHLEDPEQQRRVALALRAARFGPGEFVSGISAKWQVRAAGLVATVLVARINLPAALSLLALWLVISLHLTASRYRAYPFWIDPLKRALYLRDVGLEPHAAKEVRLFGLADWLVGRYTAAWQDVMDGLWATRRADLRRTSILALLLVLAYVIVLRWAALATIAGDLSLAELAVLVQAVLGMASLGNLAGDVWVDNGAVPIPSVLALERELVEPYRPHASVISREHPRIRQSIHFDNVSFAYPHTNRPILDGFDLTIPAGQSLALVGDNGAGKTTLLKLLPGLYRPRDGRILVGGTPLDQIDPSAWRSRTAVIFQDFVRYELSARDNIGFGSIALRNSPGAEDHLRRAAERADVLDMIDALPGGFDTILSRRFAGGVELSGGQWQRIALARALFAVESGAHVLMLDEPTAHLDVRAEIELFDRFLELTAGLTTIVVSHRFSTVRRADRIVVIADGRVEEHGSHDELLRLEGHYARMFGAQAAAFHG